MDNVNTILDSIADIQEAAYLARESVCEKINDFADKVAVMEQCGLNIMSEDPTMQFIIDNREQVAYDCNNSVFFDEAFFDESFRSKVKNSAGTLIGALCGVVAQGASLLSPSPLSLFTVWALGESGWSGESIILLLLTKGALIGGVIGHKIHKTLRKKNASSDILKHIKSVCNELGKTIDYPTETDLKKLKASLDDLIRVAEFALDNRKADVSDNTRSQLHPLIAASKELKDRVTLTDTKTNAELLKKFMTTANDVVISITSITPAEVEALNAKIKEKVAEAEQKNGEASKENAVKESGDCDDKSDDDNEKGEDENAKEEE